MTIINTDSTDAIIAFFSGKSLENARTALDLLRQSEKQGSWAPGASRKVRAALDKSNVAARAAKKLHAERAYRAFEYGSDEYEAALAVTWLNYGMSAINARQSITDAQLDKLVATAPEWSKAVEMLRNYCAVMAPVLDLIKRLDDTRPQPVFTTMGASPTVSFTLKGLGAEKVEVCPMEFSTVEKKDPETGKTTYVQVCTLLWPEDTRHNTSRFCNGIGAGGQCQACGHGIYNNFNWVPLILTSTDGTPRSLWVGRDCAKTLFGVKMTGDLEIVGPTEGK